MNYEIIYTLSLGSLGLILSSCQAPAIEQSTQWLTYQNSRFGFEFPYPNHWLPSAPPANNDGQEFYNPQNPAVQIRGWASYRVVEPEPPLEKNFQTQQGLWGQLKVNIGLEVSTMTLTLREGEIQYQWQGEAPSTEFQSYYQFFDHLASRYRVVPR